VGGLVLEWWTIDDLHWLFGGLKVEGQDNSILGWFAHSGDVLVHSFNFNAFKGRTNLFRVISMPQGHFTALEGGTNLVSSCSCDACCTVETH